MSIEKIKAELDYRYVSPKEQWLVAHTRKLIAVAEAAKIFCELPIAKLAVITPLRLVSDPPLDLVKIISDLKAALAALEDDKAKFSGPGIFWDDINSSRRKE